MTPLPQPRGSCHPPPCFVPRPCHPHHTWVPPPVASRPLPHDAAMLGPTCGLLRWGRREGASPHRPTPSPGRGGRSAISYYFKWARLAQGLMWWRGTRHGWEEGMGEGGKTPFAQQWAASLGLMPIRWQPEHCELPQACLEVVFLEQWYRWEGFGGTPALFSCPPKLEMSFRNITILVSCHFSF